jgi:hypothetical protein
VIADKNWACWVFRREAATTAYATETLGQCFANVFDLKTRRNRSTLTKELKPEQLRNSVQLLRTILCFGVDDNGNVITDLMEHSSS